MSVCLQHKFLNRKLLNFCKYGRCFSTKNYYMRNKIGAVKYRTTWEELKIEGCRRFTSVHDLTSVNISFSKMKHVLLITSTTYHGGPNISNTNYSFPTSCMIMGSRSFFSGKHIWKCQKNIKDSGNTDEHEGELEDFEEEEYDEMVKRVLHVPEMGHQVFVVQPFIKWGSGKKRNTTPELQLAEAVALIGTLPKWKVIDKVS